MLKEEIRFPKCWTDFIAQYMQNFVFWIKCFAILAAMCLPRNCIVFALPVEIAGSPTYDWNTSSGFRSGGARSVNASGIAVGVSERFASGLSEGLRAIRWDATGSSIELDFLGSSSSAAEFQFGQALAVNNTGEAIGTTDKFNMQGLHFGPRAVRWNPNTNSGIELETLGTYPNGSGWAAANDINDSGTAVGLSSKINEFFSDLGFRAVRWNGVTITELDSLIENSDFGGNAVASYVSNSGTIVGESDKNDTEGNWFGTRPVRWDAGRTSATELGVLGMTSDGVGYGYPVAINIAGVTVGGSEKIVGDEYLGPRAVRWSSEGTAATELDNLGTDTFGATETYAFAISDSGIIVGTASFYSGDDYLGARAVRWEAGGTAVTELGEFEIETNGGFSSSNALVVNNNGTAAGSYTSQYDVYGTPIVDSAIVWRENGNPIDLNDLELMAVSGGGTWHLSRVDAMADNGWMAGQGEFDPDGAGPLGNFGRGWVAQVGLGGEWLNTSGTDNIWGAGDNWSSGTPAIQLSATFDQAETYQVAFSSNATASEVNISAGNVTLALDSYSLTVDEGLLIASGATLASNGSIQGNISNAGTLAPGNSPGELTLVGDLTSTGSIEFEINAVSAGQFDRLLVNDLSLGGVIRVILGYTAALNDTFDILDFASISDDGYTFDFSQAILNSGLQWDIGSFATTGMIGVVSSTIIEGDFDADGDVDGRDFLAWQRNPSIGNLANWQANYGVGAGLIATGTAVPEPSSLLLAALAGSLFYLCRRATHCPQLVTRNP